MVGLTPFAYNGVMTKKIAALFVLRNSLYKDYPEVDCFDEDRNAMTFNCRMPVIAHPPCRGWGKLRGMSNHTQEELDLAPWAINLVSHYGGILEHPLHSKLWRHMPTNGFLLPISQKWFGHSAEKLTGLFISGISYNQLPPIPFSLGQSKTTVENLSKIQRMETPRAIVEWMIQTTLKIGDLKNG